MAQSTQTSSVGMAIIGLFFITAGFVMVFAFIIKVTGGDLPEFLEFRAEPYNLLLIGLVNLAGAVGLLYRAKSMWSITMIFIAVIMVGDLMDLFFSGNTKIAVFIIYLAVLLYMMSNDARVWYRVR